MAKWLSETEVTYYALLTVALIVELVVLAYRYAFKPHRRVSHRKLRAAIARRGLATGTLARHTAPVAGFQTPELRAVGHLQRDVPTTARTGGAAVRTSSALPLPAPGELETLPGAGTETKLRAASHSLGDASMAARTGSASGSVEPKPAPDALEKRPGAGPISGPSYASRDSAGASREAAGDATCSDGPAQSPRPASTPVGGPEPQTAAVGTTSTLVPSPGGGLGPSTWSPQSLSTRGRFPDGGDQAQQSVDVDAPDVGVDRRSPRTGEEKGCTAGAATPDVAAPATRGAA